MLTKTLAAAKHETWCLLAIIAYWQYTILDNSYVCTWSWAESTCMVCSGWQAWAIKYTISDTHGLCQMIPSIYTKPSLFANTDQSICYTSRSNASITQTGGIPCQWQQQTYQLIAVPLAHVHRIITLALWLVSWFDILINLQVIVSKTWVAHTR